MFRQIYQSKYGDTVSSDNPMDDAIKQIKYYTILKYFSGVRVNNDDKSVTVQAETRTGHKLADITFELDM